MAIRGFERTAWQDLYCIQQTSGALGVPRYNVADIGILGDGSTGGAFILKLTDHPNFTPPASLLDTRLTTGGSGRREDEYQAVNSELSTTTLNMQMNAWNAALFLRGLFQTGAAEDTSGSYQIASYTPYVVSDVTKFAGLTRVLANADSGGTWRYTEASYPTPWGAAGVAYDMYSQYMHGAVPQSITISGEEGGAMTLAVEMAAAGVGVMNVLGYMTENANIRRMRILPTPQQMATDNSLWDESTYETNVHAYHNGTSITLSVVDTESDFTAIGTGIAEVAKDTGLVNFNESADITTWDGQLLTHDAYQDVTVAATGTPAVWGFTHPTGLLPDNKAPLLWQNSVTKLRRIDPGANSPWTAAHIPSFSITLANNLTPRWYDEPYVYKYILGDFGIDGNIMIPWGTDIESGSLPTFGTQDPLVQFLQGLPTRVRVYWGSTNQSDTGSAQEAGYHYINPTGNGGFAIDAVMKYTDQSLEGENELGQTMPFTGVEDMGTANSYTRPDTDLTLGVRITGSYLTSELLRGDSAALDYPES